MDVAQPSPSDIPPHVPTEWVRRWALATAPGVEKDPFEANRVLRDERGIFYTPLMKSPTDPGTWVITRADFIREVYQDTDTFTSKNTSGMATLAGGSFDLIPLEKDGQEHAKYRMLLNPHFAPARIAAMEEGIRSCATKLTDAVLPTGGCEFMEAFGRPFPVLIFLQLMGLPSELMEKFLTWEDQILHGSSFEERAIGAKAIKTYMLEMIEERGRQPTSDLMSSIVTAKIDGAPLTTDEILGICFLLFVGGLDTVASVLGFAMKYLAENQDQQALLRRSPDLIANAVEEILRTHAVVQSPRHTARDVEFHGAPMKKGDRIVLANSVAARDERYDPRGEQIEFTRDNVTHTTFALGPHRCIGSHLARRELRIALEHWTSRAPQFRIKQGESAVTHGTTVFGVNHLPLVWS